MDQLFMSKTRGRRMLENKITESRRKSVDGKMQEMEIRWEITTSAKC